MHDILYTQQQRDAARQTVEKGWPKIYSDEELDAAIKWHMEKANVDNYYTTTHGRYMHGRYKRSQITIIHWKEDWAKQTYENYVATLQVVQQTQPSQNLGQEQSNSILRQRATRNQLCATDRMEREINLTMQAPLHIVAKRQGSDLANSWKPSLKRSTHE